MFALVEISPFAKFTEKGGYSGFAVVPVGVVVSCGDLLWVPPRAGVVPRTVSLGKRLCDRALSATPKRARRNELHLVVQ